MRVAVAVAVVLAYGHSAGADDAPLTLREGSLVRPGTDPLLSLDPIWRPNVALDAPTDTKRALFTLGESTLVSVERTQWSYDNGMTGDGWGATLRLSRAVGPIRVTGYASYQALDTRLGSGAYVDLGLSVGKTFRLSTWMTAWIALSLGHRSWVGDPPAGQSDETTLMLSVGTTFR